MLVWALRDSMKTHHLDYARGTCQSLCTSSDLCTRRLHVRSIQLHSLHQFCKVLRQCHKRAAPVSAIQVQPGTGCFKNERSSECRPSHLPSCVPSKSTATNMPYHVNNFHRACIAINFSYEPIWMQVHLAAANAKCRCSFTEHDWSVNVHHAARTFGFGL